MAALLLLPSRTPMSSPLHDPSAPPAPSPQQRALAAWFASGSGSPPALDRTRFTLDWARVTEAVSLFAETDHGRVCLEGIGLLDDEELIVARYEEISEMTRLQARAQEPSLVGLAHVHPLVERARKGEMLDPFELAAVAHAIRCAERTRLGFAGLASTLPALSRWAPQLVSHPEVAKAIESCLDADGQIADHASPTLGPLRRDVGRLRKTIIERLERILRSPKYEGILQDEFYTQRDNRFVVPVRAGERGDFPGIVHGHSGSGATLFIEPHEVVALNNELRVAEFEVVREVHRILGRLTSRVADVADTIQTACSVLTYLDGLGAAVRFGRKIRAEVPMLAGRSQTPRLLLKQARHPLLALRESRGEMRVVANDIHTSEHHRGMVISGPNTGGKTVTLKTVGLFALMVKAGLPIPAEAGSVMPIFDQVFADIGDAQAVENDLSTFSAHVTHMMTFLDACGPRTLVMLDELFGSTDPEQGAALGRALIQWMVARGAFVMVTTHLSELKDACAEHNALQAASVGFDVERLEPTYRLRCGLPGSSHAIAVARRLGMPGALLDDATRLLGTASVEREQMLTRLEGMFASVEADRDAAERARRQAERDAAEAASMRDDAARRRKELLDGEALALRGEMRRTREALRTLVAKAATPAAAAVVKEALDAAERLTAGYEEESKVEARKGRASLASVALTSGAKVWVESLGRGGIVVSAPGSGSRVVVQVGAIKTTVDRSDLYAPEEGRGASASRRVLSEPLPSRSVMPAPPEEVTTKLDLRGVQSDDAIEMLDAMLDRAVRGGWPLLLVVHGHGTGVLKRAVRDHLIRSPYVKKFRSGGQGEGGDGVTVVEL